ncbi:MAG TPA: hypothetical protein VFN67_29540 [Polyangiales bacterium]|nr:hypothetical protein [Polyangiales bacterium]
MRQLTIVIALACAACTVGNPLVDEFMPDDGMFKIQCALPPRCILWSLPEEAPSHPVEMVALNTCMKLCAWGDIQQNGCPQEAWESSLLKNAVCKGMELKLTSEDSELSWSGMDWQDVNLVLRADRPLRVSWHGGRLQHVYIELHGPIELHMDQFELFEDVRFQAEASPAGKPFIEVADVEGKTLSLGTEDKPLAGTFKLRAVHIGDLDIRADSLIIENTLVEKASIRADSLTLTDVTLHGGLIDAKNARMSVFDVDDATLEFCGDARLVAGSIVRSNVKACPESVLRVYNSKFGSCSVDGSYELDDTSVEYVALGVNDATRVVAYDSRVSSTAACSNLGLMALGAGSTLKCSGCSEQFSDDTQPACVIGEIEGALLKNYCKLWAHLEELPVCQEELPSAPDRIR